MMMMRCPKFQLVLMFLVLLFVLIFWYDNRVRSERQRIKIEEEKRKEKEKEEWAKKMSHCTSFLHNFVLNISYPALIIDENLLKTIDNGNCTLEEGKKIKIAVDVEDRRGMLALYGKHPFEVSYYKTNRSKDYFEFITDPKRIIPSKFKSRRVGEFIIPLDIPVFLQFLRRSKFVDCLGLHIPRNETEKAVLDPTGSTAALALLRDDMLDMGMFFFLGAGTFLGWYRECTVIPHTTDMDVFMFVEDFKPQYLDVLEKEDSKFRLLRKLGYLNDSFEIAVRPRRGQNYQIDVFLMYQEGDSHWFGTMTGDRSRYKFIHKPRYDPWCSADLHGHIFWTSCTPMHRAQTEFGPLFYMDHHSEHYGWYGGVNNGNWSKEQFDSFLW